jgi:hypothetical protein
MMVKILGMETMVNIKMKMVSKVMMVISEDRVIMMAVNKILELILINK